jgi:hypothetical protein
MIATFFHYYIPCLFFFFGIFFLFQYWSALLFLLGFQLVIFGIVLTMHFFALNAENVVYVGILLFGFLALVQSGLSLNHLKKALLNESSSE